MLCCHKKWILSGHGLVHFHLPNPPSPIPSNRSQGTIIYNYARANHYTFMTPSWMRIVILHFWGTSLFSNIFVNFFQRSFKSCSLYIVCSLVSADELYNNGCNTGDTINNTHFYCVLPLHTLRAVCITVKLFHLMWSYLVQHERSVLCQEKGSCCKALGYCSYCCSWN